MERRHKKYYSRVRAIFADTDAMQVVYHVNYIKWFEIGRNEMLRQSGYPYTEMVDDGIWMPVVEVGCEYKSPAIYDDLIEISAWIEYVKGAVVMIGYECRNEETGKLYVKGLTKHGITDPDLKPINLKKVYPKAYEKLMAVMEK